MSKHCEVVSENLQQSNPHSRESVRVTCKLQVHAIIGETTEVQACLSHHRLTQRVRVGVIMSVPRRTNFPVIDRGYLISANSCYIIYRDYMYVWTATCMDRHPTITHERSIGSVIGRTYVFDAIRMINEDK